MKQTVFKKIFRLSLQNLLILGGVFLFVCFVYAANQNKLSYRSVHGAVTVGYENNTVSFNSNRIFEHDICQRISVNSCDKDVFIPTKTTGEWTTFITNTPSCVTLGDCPIDARN